MSASKGWMPSIPEVAREALIVMGGALVAALIVGQLPALREWMKQQWGGSNPSI